MVGDFLLLSRRSCRAERALQALLCTASILCVAGESHADQPLERVSSIHYEVAPDYTYKVTLVIDDFVQKQAEIKDLSQLALTYDPERTTFRFVKGWVDGADGIRHEPAPNAVFTRPSAASRDAPGFVSSVTTTVVMPAVTTGSRVHYEVEEVLSKPSVVGFNLWAWLNPFEDASEHVVIDIPSALTLNVASQGGFVVSDTTAGGMRHIVADASLRNVSAGDREQHMANLLEFQPLFLGTSLHGYNDVGDIYYRLNRNKPAVTPEINALAKQIVGDRKGLDAARAIYDWCAKNIRYLAVIMSFDDGWESHDAATVLKNGYGDCKDHVTLMQALLSATGIRSEAALVDWSDRTKPLPLPSPGETNHAIIYLPDFDIFANPTSPFTPFGVLDQGLSGKLAIVAGEHSEVRRTPEMKPETAEFVTTGAIHIGSDGTVGGQASETMSPSIEEPLRSALQNPDENNRRIDRKLRNTPEGGFGHLATTGPYDLDHPFQLNMNWHSPHGIDPTAGAFVLPSPPSFDPIDGLRSFLDRNGRRSTPMALPVRDLTWNFSVALPPDMTIANAPKSVDVNNDVGSYKAVYERRDNCLLVHRQLVLKARELEPAAYSDLERLVYAAQNDFTAIVTTTASASSKPEADNGKCHP